MNAVAPHPEAIDYLRYLERSIVGRHAAIDTPFGRRPLVYADYTASGRSLDFLERAILEQVAPGYANTHTEASFTGRHSNALRESARQAIREAVQADDATRVIFTGSGATAAINKAVQLLGLALPEGMAKPPVEQRAVVFVGPYEHHSNELPWRESAADVVRIPLDEAGAIDQDALEQALNEHADRTLLIGSFSAASNVTGVISDVEGITKRLKSHGALALWDYAAGGPYLPMSMNINGAELDAIFVSPHKFLGGPGTPGVLVARDSVVRINRPSMVGGGTVRYVSPAGHDWNTHPELREEGGTPGIVESIRAGAVFRLKDKVGAHAIAEREHALTRYAMSRLQAMPTVDVLGPQTLSRLPIFSLRFRFGNRELHHGFVVTLLNDLFGIQVRGGCSCAGPYGHDLLKLDSARSERIEQQVAAGYSSLRPGWVRFNCHWVVSDAEVDYLLSAIELIAKHGWRLLPSYTLDAQSGRWRHRDELSSRRPSVDDLLSPNAWDWQSEDFDPARLLSAAEALLLEGSAPNHRCATRAEYAERAWPVAAESERWFVLPGDIVEQLD